MRGARALHVIAGRVVAAFLFILAMTGVWLALATLLQGAPGASLPPHLTVARLVERLERGGALERVEIRPEQVLLATYVAPRRRVAIDLATFEERPAPVQSAWDRAATELHRSLGLGDFGRLSLALATALGLFVILSGVAAAPAPQRNPIHRRLGLSLAAPLAFSAATGLLLAAGSIFPGFANARPPVLGEVSADGARLRAEEVAALQAIPAADLEELILPAPDEPGDVYRIVSRRSVAYVDPVAGTIIAERPQPIAHGLARTALRWHAGYVSPWVALLLGMAGALAPILVVSGLAGDVRGLIARFRTQHRDIEDADTILLFGGESGTTEAFAQRLATTLRGLGHHVRVAPMNALADAGPAARRLLVFAATHGDGEAPRNADAFLTRLAACEPPPAYAVLGFGDSAARRFCGFAEDVDAALRDRGRTALLAMGRVDRRSEQDYARWVAALIAALGRAPTAPAPAEAIGAPATGARPLQRVTLSGPAMGGRWRAIVYTPAAFDARGVAAALAARIETIEAAMTRFRADSEILRLDAAAPARWTPVSADMASALAIALDVGRRSQGAFDVGAGAETAQRGFGGGWAAVGAARSARVSAHEAIELDVAGRRLRRFAPCSLDLAGIAKGYAVDAACELLREAGLDAHLVALDGELRAGAAQPDGRPWMIGLEAPSFGRRETLGCFPLVDRAVATSGDYRRFGPQGAHTLDPRTGAAACGAVASVSAFARTCAEADAWATALLVLGRAGVCHARVAGVEVIFAQRQRVTATMTAKSLYNFTDKAGLRGRASAGFRYDLALAGPSPAPSPALGYGG